MLRPVTGCPREKQTWVINNQEWNYCDMIVMRIYLQDMETASTNNSRTENNSNSCHVVLVLDHAPQE